MQDIHEYSGEYGTEFTTFIPYIYYLKSNGLLDKKVLTYRGMRSYYFFLEDDEIIFKDEHRDFVPYEERFFVPENIRIDDNFVMNCETPKEYLPPPYSEHFKKLPFVSDRPIVLVFNKYNSEWGTMYPPANYLDMYELASIATIFDGCIIVYFRTNQYNSNDYTSDKDELEVRDVYSYDEKAFLKGFRNVACVEDIMKTADFDFNTMKGLLLANASLTISTLTGSTHFNMYFPCNHIVYRKLAPYPFSTDTYYKNLNKILSNSNSDKVDYVTSLDAFFRVCWKHAENVGTNSPDNPLHNLYSNMEKNI